MRTVYLLAIAFHCIGLALIYPLLAEQPPRVFIRAGIKTHGPNEHDHPRFLREWQDLLSERGMQVSGGMAFPTAERLAVTDVIVIYAADGMRIVGEDRKHFEAFLRRGGGVVVLHDGIVSGDQNEWSKRVTGGAWIWEDRRTKWLHGDVGIYFVNQKHPIAEGISNFDWEDEIYYDLDMADDVNVIASSFHSVFVIAPQIWTLEKIWEGGHEPYRAFVSLPGHYYDVFNTPHYRALLLRGIAWTLRRADVNEFCTREELSSLSYPEGGPLHPDHAVENLELHPDFEIELVASEPQINNVLSLDWAADGKLWVAESPEYPNGRTIDRNDDPIYPDRALNSTQHQGGTVMRPALDRISWLEDGDGDGRHERRHIFADHEHGVPGGLELVTSFVFHRDGVIVAQAPEILWLRDTNQDGVCDKVETLYHGFGDFDSHAVLNNFRWGLDGWVYATIGYSAGRPVSSRTGESFGRVTAGVIRFKPDGTAVEQVASGSCNTWGFDFAPDGELFFTTATCGQHFLHVVMPEPYLARGNVGGMRASHVVPDHQDVHPARSYNRPAYVQIDWVGGFTAASGCCIYNGGAWPDIYEGSHFVSEPTVNLLHHEILTATGVTYDARRQAGRENTEFLRGTDLWFRPIHQRVGPDGALYLVDLYNQAAIHNDTRGPKHGARNAATRPDRDHKFARIYRIQHRRARRLEIPLLYEIGNDGLVAALEHANGWVRDTAARLLRERNAKDQAVALENCIRDRGVSNYGRTAALHTLEALDALPRPVLEFAVLDPVPALRKNALKLFSDRDPSGFVPKQRLVRQLVNDGEPRVQLNALLALSTVPLNHAIAAEVVNVWPSLADPWMRSAALAVAGQDLGTFIRAVYQSGSASQRTDLAGHVARMIGERQDAEQVARLVIGISRQPYSKNRLNVAVLDALVKSLRESVNPEWTQDLRNGLVKLVSSSDDALVDSVLPMVVRWDREGELTDLLKPPVSRLKTRLEDDDITEGELTSVAATLLGMRRYDDSMVEVVGDLLDRELRSESKMALIDALGSVSDLSAGSELITRIPGFPPSLRDRAFGHVIKRADWTQRLLDAVEERELELASLGPGNLHSLRTHSVPRVGKRALALIATLRGPETRQKDQLIAGFSEIVQQPFDLNRGEALFAENCSLCHSYRGEGADLAPDLTGMGVHGPLDLLTHIIDPNRVVEPNFVTTSVETDDDQVIDGIVAGENQNVLTLRNAVGTYEIRKDTIYRRRSSGRSLMPDGYEALEGEALRDLIGYLCLEEGDYRVLDLANAYTANSKEGIYRSRKARGESLRFKRFGLVRIDGVPFDIVDPVGSTSGKNLIVLKGGEGFAKSLPQSVTLDVGVGASRLYILGGVGGWAWPHGGEEDREIPVSKITIRFAGGEKEERILRNGIEIADYARRAEIPGSREAVGLVRYGQVRWFGVDIENGAVIESITLESYDTKVAPTYVALTLELR